VPCVELAVPGIDLGATLRPTALLGRDPTVHVRPGRFDRATLTPAGPAALSVTWRPGASVARVEAWGDGAEWVLQRAPGLLGLADDPTGFAPVDGPVRELWRRHPGLRLARTATLWHDLAALIVQQRVTGLDASLQWGRLVRALGEPAPGPTGLVLPPSPRAIAGRAYHDLHRFGIERQRAERLRTAARVVERLAPRVDRPLEQTRSLLTAVPGIGPWTAGYLAAVTWGEPDAVIVGDDGLPGVVGWLLDGDARADDARMLELLEPHRPHRYRALRLLLAARVRPPRRHHRARRIDIRSR
jgi:3-methyladenine DNA glycosylase/8-oxoguanine DNA glycosylase